jgi:nucleoside phosphorylase
MERAIGVVCALPEELGSLRALARRTQRHVGLDVHELELSGCRVLASVSGVGKVAAARAFAGPCVAEMETAAVAAVASAAGVPWAALRAVTDRATLGGAASFRIHFQTQAARAADTVGALLERLGPA